ncbi:hypothetical protein C8R46DRAFT_1048251 [Mycena filopes]|nr:hypothetical protein C8R46DRAFT_1048251 [Mycena filopes]
MSSRHWHRAVANGTSQTPECVVLKIQRLSAFMSDSLVPKMNSYSLKTIYFLGESTELLPKHPCLNTLHNHLHYMAIYCAPCGFETVADLDECVCDICDWCSFCDAIASAAQAGPSQSPAAPPPQPPATPAPIGPAGVNGQDSVTRERLLPDVPIAFAFTLFLVEAHMQGGWLHLVVPYIFCLLLYCL